MTLSDVLSGDSAWCALHGDVLDRLREMPDESVNCIVTSPPYWGLRDYGIEGQIGLEATLGEYIEKMVTVFREARRVLRGDGTCWMNLGDLYASQPSWGRADHTSTLEGRKHSEMPFALKDERGRRTRGALGGLKPKDMVGLPWRLAFALQADGWYLRSDIIWHKSNPMPESAEDRPTRSHEYLFLLAKSSRYRYDADAIKEPVTGGAHARAPMKKPAGWETGGGGHGASHRDGRENGVSGVTPKSATPGPGNRIKANSSFHAATVGLVTKRNKRTVWTIATEGFTEAHFATFPTALVEPCVLAGCPIGGIVLDCFSGSGTTGVVALRHGRRYIGIEINSEYVEMSRRRIVGDSPMFNATSAAAS